MNISAPFIRRPVATSLLAAAVMLAGVAGYTHLAVAPLPKVDFPVIAVSASLPGASPETMASAVATPLERRFGRIAGISEITSTSSLGATSLVLQFSLDRDIDAAGRDVQAAINAASGDLPTNLPNRPRWQKANPNDAPVMVITLNSPTLPLGTVFDQANTILAQKLAQLEGVGQVFVGGGQQPAVRVQADPEALAAMGLTLEDVRKALVTATSNSPKGGLSGEDQSRAVAANDQLMKAADYQQIIIASNKDSVVRLKDVADVMDDVENRRQAAWADGERCVLLIVRRQPGANILEVIERITKLLPSLASSISPSIKMTIASDRSQTIRASVRDVQWTLIFSVVLVVLVVFVFLRSVRATAIPSVAVPLSLMGTFGFMYLLDYSIDNLSLMALTISTGFVVDDAIVVTENITRYIEAGESPLQAALKGAKQIGFTIVSITVSLIAVFLPLLLMGGLVGRLFREFAVTLSLAIAVSAVISLTLTPMMAARLLKPASEGRHEKRATFGERFFNGLLLGYERGLDWVLKHNALMLGVTGMAIVVAVALFVLIPKGLFPQQDTGQLTGFTEAPQDISFNEMKERQAALNPIMMADPAVSHAVSFTGGGWGGAAGNTGTAFLTLKPIEERKVSADEIINRLRPQLAKVQGINLYLQSMQDVRMGGRPTRTQYQFTLQDANMAELNEWAPKVLERLRKLPQLKDVATDQQTGGLQLDVNIDRDTASRLGVTPRMVDDTLYDAFGQRQVATMYTQLNQYRVVLEVKPKYATDPDALRKLYVGPGAGVAAPLMSLAKFGTSVTPLSVSHQGQFPAITISFNLAPGASLGQAIDAIHAAETEIGVPASIHAAFAGTAQAFQDSLASEGLLVLAALITVYIVLGVLYESLIHPITILSTLPSAGVGALLALMLFRTEFSVIALIGIILLIGIVKKNAIMMIDFAIEAERDQGLTTTEAIRQACLLRFRPIMMTTLAALFGGLPLALGHGAGAELRQPLGIAIVGGLIVSQMLTLFTTPVIYLTLDRFTKTTHRPVGSPTPEHA